MALESKLPRCYGRDIREKQITKVIFRRLLRFYLSHCPVTEGKGRLYRLLSESLLPPESEVTAILPPGFHMNLDMSDPAQREIFFFSTYERKETALVRKILRPGDIFWDVGASIGYYTLLAAACVGPAGRAVAFEPFAPAWDRLNANIALNAFRQVKCVNAVVGECEGEADLFFERRAADGVATLAPTAAQISFVKCKKIPLDRFMADESEAHPTFIKADVEGSEKAVLDGAEKILTGAEPPMLLLEMEDEQFARHGTSKFEIQALLARNGYHAFQIAGRRWISCHDIQAARCRNIFWLNPAAPLHRARAKGANLVFQNL